MSDFKFYIRYGVHKDREVIKCLRDSISGIAVPAHILCYSPDATIAALSYVNKVYFIDPMTFLFAESKKIQEYVVLDKKTQKNTFKPSIRKLADSYGILNFFENNGFAPLNVSDFTQEFSESFCKKNIDLQSQKFDEGKVNAYKKYEELLRKVGEEHMANEMKTVHSPQAIIPPYFYLESLDSGWLDVNLKLAQITAENTTLPVVPLIFAHPSLINEKLLDKYAGYSEIFIWVDDLEKKNSLSVKELSAFASFVNLAKDRGIKITNLYGSYFSVLLSKLGLAGMCNGVFYGESKGKGSKVGGVPQARYYIRILHEFFPIPSTIALLKQFPDLLDKDCDECMKIIKGNIENIFEFTNDHALAQTHFVLSRSKEIRDAEEKELSTLLQELGQAYEKYQQRGAEFEEITDKGIQYLHYWKDAIESVTSK